MVLGGVSYCDAVRRFCRETRVPLIIKIWPWLPETEEHVLWKLGKDFFFPSGGVMTWHHLKMILYLR